MSKGEHDDSGSELSNGAAKTAQRRQGPTARARPITSPRGARTLKPSTRGMTTTSRTAQGRVKHPETDKRLKGNNGAGDELHGAAKDAHESKANGQGKANDEHEPHGQGAPSTPRPTSA